MTNPPRSTSDLRHPWTRRQLLEGFAATFAAASALGALRSPAFAAAPAAAATAAAADASGLPSELWRAGAGQLAEAIAKKRVSSLEVVEAHLARIQAVNPKLDAMPVVFADEARAAAMAADAAIARGDQLGPLHGVPFSIKDNLDQAGKANTDGIEENKGRVAKHDAPVVERMRAAGGIPIGRTNLPDLALRVHSYSELWGRCLNPWNPKRNVGGSSGGEAAALATGMSPIGLGNDIGGSLRNPANCCGIAALKPSFGRIPNADDAGSGGAAGQLMAVNGPMARTIADVRLGYQILAGQHVRDPWSMPVPLDLPDPPGPIRVALVAEPSGGKTHPGRRRRRAQGGQGARRRGLPGGRDRAAATGGSLRHLARLPRQRALLGDGLLQAGDVGRGVQVPRPDHEPLPVQGDRRLRGIAGRAPRPRHRVVGVLHPLPAGGGPGVHAAAVRGRLRRRRRRSGVGRDEPAPRRGLGQPARAPLGRVAGGCRGRPADGRAGDRRPLPRGPRSRWRGCDREGVGRDHADRSEGLDRRGAADLQQRGKPIGRASWTRRAIASTASSPCGGPTI